MRSADYAITGRHHSSAGTQAAWADPGASPADRVLLMSEGSHRQGRAVRIAIAVAASLSLIVGAATAYAYVLVIQNNGTGTTCFTD